MNLGALLPADRLFDVEHLIADWGTIKSIMASPGVYVFRRNGYDAYVGRGDSDGIARMRKSYRAARYDKTVLFYPATSKRRNYLRECKLYHKLNPCDNERHPAVPAGANWRCPVKSCPLS